MSRHKNQLRDTKLTDIQINYWIKKWADVQIHHRLQHEQTYKSMGDEINIPKSFKD